MRRSTVLAAAAAVLFATGAFAATNAGEGAEPVYGKYLAARLAANDFDLSEAARLYREALKGDPDNAELLNRAFVFTAESGDIDASVPLGMRMLKTDPQNRIVRVTLAVAALRHHDYAAARMHIAGSARGPFHSLTLTILDTWAAQGAGDITTALKDADDIATQGGSPALAAFHKAAILDLAGRDAEADAAYQAAVTLSHDGAHMVEAYGRFLVRTGRSDEAKVFYQKYLSDPGMEPVASSALKNIERGRKPERLIPDAAAGAAEGLFGIASALPADSSMDYAILYLRFALFLQPDLDLAKIVLADRFETLKKYEDAIAVYETIDLDTPYGPAAAVQAAIDYGRLKQNDKAIATLKMLARSRPGDIAVWTALGDAYRATENWPEAQNAYDKAIGTVPAVTKTDWPLFYARGVARERNGDWAGAEADLGQALKLAPDQPSVLNYLGYSWVDQGKNLPEALAMLERARTLSPFDGYIVDSVGWAYYKLGRYGDAARTLEDAVLLVPGDPTINDHLGDAYWKVGRKLDAHFQWSHALAFGPADKDKAAIQKKLDDSLAVAEAPGG